MYFGPSKLIREAVAHMRKRRFGIVVNMSSGAGLEGRESMGAYAPAKAALDSMSKVLAKKISEFNLHFLIVSLGAFNTNMVKAVTTSKNPPMLEDYKGSVAEKTIDFMASGHFHPEGDKEKAVKAMYEVVMREGVGAGQEGERFLPLGRDVASRVKQVQDQYSHSMEVFGHICINPGYTQATPSSGEAGGNHGARLRRFYELPPSATYVVVLGPVTTAAWNYGAGLQQNGVEVDWHVLLTSRFWSRPQIG
ncbi:hypothetical protein V500_04326 [Pseudogymnoascus sp. VKM F-4518 (FW-2643)]|nr:hypothetical protein V500_04326 [Pseudogymnoascus sp. VKM F-4518 (FW-2643)]